MDSAIEKVSDVVFSKSSEETQNVYNGTWHETYDEDMVTLGFRPPHEVAKMFEKHAMNSKVVLDVGGGTGSVIELARKAGFKNTFDVLDASWQMLIQGEKKQLNIRNIIRHFIQEDGILPLKDESYDVVTCAGAFSPNHIPASAIKGIFNVLKPGGLMIVTARSNIVASYKIKHDKAVKELKATGKIEVIDKYEFMHCEKVESQDDRSIVYVYKRL